MVWYLGVKMDPVSPIQELKSIISTQSARVYAYSKRIYMPRAQTCTGIAFVSAMKIDWR